MSEARQRRGEQISSKAATGRSGCADNLAVEALGTQEYDVAEVLRGGEGVVSDVSCDELVNQVTDMIWKLQAGPKPGCSNNVKQWRDLLIADPNNLEYMHALGLAYAEDRHWDKCANVMARGVKRTDEFSDLEKSYDYLHTLCQASLKVKKYKQAMMVLQDMKAPTEGTFVEFQVIQCQVYCANGDSQRGIEAFHEAIQGSDFADACSAWAMSLTYLKQVGAYDICKHALEALAQKEEEPQQAQKKLTVLESMVTLKEHAKEQASNTLPWGKIAKYTAVIYIICIMYFLYYLEGKSLSNLKIGKRFEFP